MAVLVINRKHRAIYTHTYRTLLAVKTTKYPSPINPTPVLVVADADEVPYPRWVPPTGVLIDGLSSDSSLLCPSPSASCGKIRLWELLLNSSHGCHATQDCPFVPPSRGRCVVGCSSVRRSARWDACPGVFWRKDRSLVCYVCCVVGWLS